MKANVIRIVKKINNSNIIDKLLRIISIFIVGILIINIFVYYISFKETNLIQIKKSNDYLVEQVAISFETIIKQIKDSISQIVLYDNDLKDMINNHSGDVKFKLDLSLKLNRILLSNEFFHSVYLYLPQHDEVYSTHHAGIKNLEDFTDKGVFNAITFDSSRLFVLSPRKVSLSSSDNFNIGRQVNINNSNNNDKDSSGGNDAKDSSGINYDNDNLFISVLSTVPLTYESYRGVLVINADANMIYYSILRKIKAESNMNFYAFDKEERIIIDKDKSKLFHKIDINEFERSIKFSSFARYLFNNNDMITSSYLSKPLNWTFVLQTQVYNPLILNSFINNFLYLTLFITAAIMLILIIVRHYAKPVKDMLRSYNDNIWKEFLTGNTGSINNISEIIAAFNSTSFESYYTVILAKSKNIKGDYLNSKINDKKQNRYLKYILKTVVVSNSSVALIVNLKRNLKDSEDVIEAIVNEVISIMCEYNNTNYMVTIGLVKDNIALVSDSYKECMDALNYRIWSGSDIIYYHTIRDKRFLKCNYPYVLEKKLVNNIIAGNEYESISVAHDFIFSVLEMEGAPDDNLIKNYIYQLQIEVMKRLNNNEVQLPENIDLNLLDINNSGDLTDTLNSYISKIIAEIHNCVNKCDSKLASNIMSFFESNYINNEFDLNKLADEFKISRTWTSKIVKNMTGKSFNICLRDKRIILAKKLLTDTDLTIEEIAKKTGFSYANYFVKLFKEIEGITPGQYRDSFYKQNTPPSQPMSLG